MNDRFARSDSPAEASLFGRVWWPGPAGKAGKGLSVVVVYSKGEMPSLLRRRGLFLFKFIKMRGVKLT